MTTITLNLSPELEHQIRTEASRQGVEPDRYILIPRSKGGTSNLDNLAIALS